MQKDLAAALKHAEALILAVPHEQYLDLDPDQIVKWAGGPLAVIDCYGILSDEQDSPLFRARLRGESPRPRPYPADQRAGAGEGEVRSGEHKADRPNFESPRPTGEPPACRAWERR